MSCLQFNKTLERLDISWNGLGYEGSVALSKCLKKNRSLKEIDVSNNRIDWLGAPLIAVGLKKNGVLKKLMVVYKSRSDNKVIEFPRKWLLH